MHGGPGDGEDSSRSEAARGFDESLLDVPNCPSCLHRMEVAETKGGGVHWACSFCGQRKLA